MSKACRGLPAAAFWELREKINERLPADEAQRLARADRRRTRGGGRDCAHPRVSRGALVLTSLRLPIPQEAGARLYGATPAEGAHALRRLLPVIQAALPCPNVGQHLAAGADLSPEQGLQ